MRALIFVSFLCTLLMMASCATPSNYDAKVKTWVGQDQSLLIKSWGEPDDVEKLSNGDKMLVYPRLKHRPVAYLGSGRAVASTENESAPVYIKCATYFEVNSQE